SASLADRLAGVKEVSVLSKLKSSHNPNVKQCYPQLLLKMKRRVGTKNISPVPSLGSQSNYNQANGHRENFVTTTFSVSQYHIISPLQIHDFD
ncbi:heat shock transcription factor, Y-linked-like, partial [Bos mutus]|uniref:heat shock transcription factor, Y-linked-like n=1 Tax=Bos mutus TaxID=72004 RepID=UPI0038B4697A